MIGRFDHYEGQSGLMTRFFAALILNPRRCTETVLRLAWDVDSVGTWATSARNWIRAGIGGDTGGGAVTPPIDDWDVGAIQVVAGDELDAFERARVSLHVGADTDIGDWWEGQGGSHPGLCAVARRLRTMPITSTILERFFSRARSVLDYTMGASDPDTIRKRLVLYLNKEVTEFVLAAHPEVLKAGRILLDEYL
jgi:hypothetical protein